MDFSSYESLSLVGFKVIFSSRFLISVIHKIAASSLLKCQRSISSDLVGNLSQHSLVDTSLADDGVGHCSCHRRGGGNSLFLGSNFDSVIADASVRCHGCRS